MVKKAETRTVLVIEDEATVRDFACRLLELEGYHVLEAETGEEGLRLARGSRVDLVLLDLRLPGLDGRVVLEQLKSEPELSSIPVIVFTASAAPQERDRLLSMGAVDYLVKPMSVGNLRKAVAAVLGPRRRG